MTAYRFLEPLDVLFLRGNKLFGDPGSHGESLVPPWPSLAAGAIRSLMLVRDGVELGAFARGETGHPTLGTPQQPGAFAVTTFTLARRAGGEGVEALHRLPADLVVTGEGSGRLALERLEPRALAEGIASSAPLARVAALGSDQRAKPRPGMWLDEAGWQRYLAGELPEPHHLVDSQALWKIEARVGVGLDPEQRRAEDGKLFTAQAVGLEPGCGFLVGVSGAEPPAEGTVRLGGDGRGAALRAVEYRPPEPDYEAIAGSRRCRIVLTSPGIFAAGWRPSGCDAEGRFALGAVRARLTSAAVSRAEVVSGWDLARAAPKPALRVAPAGSVYWLEALEASPEALRELARAGLWPEQGPDPARRAEGFNRFTFAAYR